MTSSHLFTTIRQRGETKVRRSLPRRAQLVRRVDDRVDVARCLRICNARGRRASRRHGPDFLHTASPAGHIATMTPPLPQLRAMTPDDWSEVARIFAEGMATGQATFATEVPSLSEWDAAHLDRPRLVAADREQIVGWAALAPVSRRTHYRGVAEVSVYVGDGSRGHGIGHSLLNELVAGSEAAGLWTLMSSIFPENEASIAMHLRCGFRQVGRRERIAQHAGVWRDTLLLERRSRVVG